MTYEAANAWLLSRINYERAPIPYHQRQLKLDRMRQLLVRLGNPDSRFPIIHVAGTKGKGSTCALLGSALSAAGYRVGNFSSPHFESICERFSIDGIACSPATFAQQVDKLRPVVEQMDDEAEQGEEWDRPTFFEICTAIGFSLFADSQVDVATIEVGLGGRLDSTNVCLPTVTVITSISFDHMRQLGNTLAAIAMEKAGIVKPGVPVVTGVTNPEPLAAIHQRARDHGCRLIAAQRDFRYTSYHVDEPMGTRFDYESVPSGSETVEERLEMRGIYIRLLGQHQALNGAVATATLLELRKQGWNLPDEKIRQGFAKASLPGRIEVFPVQPITVVDTCHNLASAVALVETLSTTFPVGRKTLLLSISRDKEVQDITAALIPHFERIVVTQFQENPRAVPAQELGALVREIGTRNADLQESALQIIDQPTDAYAFACQGAGEGDVICIAGSFFLAAELRSHVVARQPS